MIFSIMILFKTTHIKISDFLNTLSIDEIEDCFDSKVFYRGKEYYENGLVEEASLSADKLQFHSTVIGNDDYHVTINLRDGNVSASCTCPYGGFCKHIAASLLYALEEEVSELSVVPDAKEYFLDQDKYLHGLPKNELVRLVKKFAPEQFWLEIKNGLKDSSTAKNIFSKVEAKIKKIFKDDSQMYDPYDFDTALNKELKKLRGLEKQLIPMAETLLLHFIDQVEEAIDDGYLYDSYNDDMYVPSDEFINFFSTYAQNLAFDDKIKFLSRIEMAINESNYSIFDGLLQQLHDTALTDEDFVALKERVMIDSNKFSHQLIERCYDKLAPVLSEKEKEIMLLEIRNNDKWAIELAQLYDSQGQTTKAIDTIKNRLANNGERANEAIYSYHLDLLLKAELDISEAAKEAICHRPSSSMLQKIASILDGETKAYEVILEQKSEAQLLAYLEANDRLDEALDLIKRRKHLSHINLFDFFKRHKKMFPTDAGIFFCNEINKNLEYTGDSYYHAVANNLKQLKQINQPLFNENLRNIKFHYKRRRNLMDILSKI
jgi:uncharacterized protein YdhG (YjbR/CyaY superfamily)